MAIISNVIAPIFQLIFYISMIAWIIFLLFKAFKKIFPNFAWVMKYKVLRKPYKEEDVELCMDLISQGKTEVEMKRDLILQKQSIKKSKEMLYIIRQINKELKGGIKSDEQKSSKGNGKGKEKQKKEKGR